MPDSEKGLQGAGLGLRRALLGPLSQLDHGAVDFMEVAPENWIGVGGRFGRQFRAMAERYPIVLHGLSLDIGGPDPVDTDLVSEIGAFMRRYHVPIYSEHLTYCAAEGHLYDLLPIPFTDEAVRHVATRVKQVQEILGQRPHSLLIVDWAGSETIQVLDYIHKKNTEGIPNILLKNFGPCPL